MLKLKRLLKAELLIPFSLVLLSLIPVLGGVVRMTELNAGVVTRENARFLESPLPITLHIVSATVYSLVGAFQFGLHFRKRKPRWHRASGKVLVLMGLVVAGTGLWMNQFYPSANFDGAVMYSIRLVVAVAMAVFLILGINAIRQRNYRVHGAWMIRAYALALGAGTQAFTLLPTFVFPSIQGESTRTIGMALGWAINLAFAEWVINRSSKVNSQFVTTGEQNQEKR